MAAPARRERRRRGGGRSDGPPASLRKVDYRHLRNPFAPQTVFSEDRIAAIHDTALRVLEELGIRVLLPEGRQYFADAGALVDEETQMVRIGRDIVENALASAPSSFTLNGATPERTQVMELDVLTFMTGAGAPHATDLERGRRPATLQDYTELTKLTQCFDAFAVFNAVVEPQDVPTHLRHYATMRAQLTLGDKVPWIFSRGTPQVTESFEMVRMTRGLTEEEFADRAWCFTVINSNSPRQLDIPMTQGIIDFAKAGQMLIMTPFCLAGAMAPITIAGAMTLQHAEALAGITLSQLVRPGAPILYGSFLSNVDMKSGAPAFGTPEHVKATLGSGQLARLIGLPWRSAAGSAANINDAQAAHETQMSLWGSVLAGATTIVHAAGWLEGGLTVSYEKLITDLEAIQTIAELCVPPESDTEAIGFDAIAEVEPGGHFFAAEHTMSRYQTAFYEPIVADWSNFGAWTEAGAKTANERATGIWKQRLADFVSPVANPGREEALDAYIAERTEAGGAPPES